VQGGGVFGRPLGRVAVALEVERGEADRAVRELAGDADHGVVDAELPCERGDVVGDLLGQRAEHQCRREHRLHHAGSERKVPTRHQRRELLRGHRRERPQIDRVARHRPEDGLDEDALELGQPARGCRRRRDPARCGVDFVGVRAGEHERVGAGQRDGHRGRIVIM
jgi:hypothetical protein